MQVLLSLGVLGAAAGVWMLLHPAAFWLKPWRPQAEVVGHRFIFGPYPIERDFQALQQKGVTTIVSLLDEDLPYEMVLLGQEQALAEKYGMRVLNFPMASILGQSFGKDYVANSEAAAKAAIAQGGIVYIHCYLGLHRAANVRKLLEQYSGRAAHAYAGTRPNDRSPDRLALDRADIAFMEGRMEDALREAAAILVKTPQSRLLEAWAHYRLNRIDEAQALFAQVLAEAPDALDAMSGLGLCALRRNDLAEAEKQFGAVLAQDADDLQAVEGLGYVRYRQGRAVEARQLFERVLERHPENEEVRQILEKLRLSARRGVIVIAEAPAPPGGGAAPGPG